MATADGDPSTPPFDIVTTYNRLLSSDPDLTMPVAAIESLVEALSASTASTISETLSLLSTHTAALKRATPNPISLSAGTDLFQRYLITTLNRGTGFGSTSDSDSDFAAVRAHLLQNGRVFVERAKASRTKIAGFGRHLVRDGATVLTNGGSRVVGALLKSAAEAGSAKGAKGRGGSIRFRVVYVLANAAAAEKGDEAAVAATAKEKAVGGASTGGGEGSAIVAMLRERGVPVATIPESAVAYAMGKVTMVLVGAEGVVENGGIISRLGTYQMGVLAKAAGKPFYVVAESHKFVRLYPLSQFDLPIAQKVIEFKVGEPGNEVPVEAESDGSSSFPLTQAPAPGQEKEGVDIATSDAAGAASKCTGSSPADAVDFTVSS
jgi:translation initiation factor eIF-2B subunit alpha